MPSRVPFNMTPSAYPIERQSIRILGGALLAEVMDADAEQSNRAASGIRLVEQRDRARDALRLVARRRSGVAPRDRREIAVADLDRQRPREQLPARQPLDRVCRHLRALP